MLSEIATELVVIVFLVMLNGIFAMSEIAVVTSRRIRLEQRAEAGDSGAAAALSLASDPAPFLSTVQVGITLIGILAGAFGGATLSEEFSDMFAQVPALRPWADPLSLALVVGGITYLSLIIGELVPKRVALGAPERIAAIVAHPMKILSRLASPLVRLLTISTNTILRILGIRVSENSTLTEQEIRAMIEEGAESGVVAQDEHELVESVFRLGDRNVRSIMTPRRDLEWIDISDDSTENESLALQLSLERRSVYLVCDAELDHVLGFVKAEDVLVMSLDGSAVDRELLKKAVREPIYAPSSMPVLQLVEIFRSKRQHAAIILDEFGGVTGVVTPHDILEALVGDLPSPDGEDEGPSVELMADGSMLVLGTRSIMDVEVDLDVELRADGRADYDTLAGFVLARLERLPKTGDSFNWAGFSFTVQSMDKRRIEKVLISRI